jgi:hypothetical protein
VTIEPRRHGLNRHFLFDFENAKHCTPESPAAKLLRQFHPERPRRSAVSTSTAKLTADSIPLLQQLFLHYTDAALDEMLAAQESFLDAVEFEPGSLQYKLWVGLWLGVFGVTSGNSLKKNGGDDGTRSVLPC